MCCETARKQPVTATTGDGVYPLNPLRRIYPSMSLHKSIGIYMGHLLLGAILPPGLAGEARAEAAITCVVTS